MTATADAAPVLAALAARGSTLAVAESLTGGLLAGAITAVPGASAVFRGGVVAYATDLKHSLLGVPAALLASAGPVSAPVAAAMAEGVRVRLGADHAVSTTGVAGPDPQDGVAPGRVFLAVAGPRGTITAARVLEGDRAAVRDATVTAALYLLLEYLGGPQVAPGERMPEARGTVNPWREAE
jgi:nicotinamide-nucleotide amidase